MSESKHTIYESRASTHADDCWSWGPGHYKCAFGKIERLRTENARLREDAARYRLGLRYAVRVWVLSDEIAWSEETIDEAVENIIDNAKKEAGND